MQISDKDKKRFQTKKKVPEIQLDQDEKNEIEFDHYVNEIDKVLEEDEE